MLNQLQELDKQISDLRLDVEKTSEERLETDSRPSSGECGGMKRNPAVMSCLGSLCLAFSDLQRTMEFVSSTERLQQNKTRQVCYSVA